MRALADLFRLKLDAPMIEDIVAGPAFSRHSKFDKVFSADARVEEQQAAEALHAEEIEKVVAWAEKVAESRGISLRLEAPLLA